MGVAGLWDVLRPVGKTRSLTHLSVVDGFEANASGFRGIRVGIDASIWFYHAAYGKEGENPELRTLFFKCIRLLGMPFLPVFVFDGPKRPKVKRGKRISGKNHWMVSGMQKIISAFGFEYINALGEAEAELAYLNSIGVIDAIITDDVDTFLFGGRTVIRNFSSNLSGNKAHPVKNADGKVDDNHSVIYDCRDFLDNPNIGLTQGGLILIGILRGGDYHQGLNGCGTGIAHGLAKCGFGDSLLAAARKHSREDLEIFLDSWREDLREELRTNSRGHIGRKNPSLAKSIPANFPDIDVLLSYTNPITSESKGKTAKDFNLDWEKELNLAEIAGVCELYFEWGVKDIIIKRFRNFIWPSAVLRILRRSSLISDRGKTIPLERCSSALPPATPRKSRCEQPIEVGTPSKMIAKHFSSLKLDSPSHEYPSDEEYSDDEDMLIVKIHSSRMHARTGGILEYRLEIAPAQLVQLTEAGVKGLRTEATVVSDDDEFGDMDDDDGDDEGSKKKSKRTKKPPPDPSSHLRVWMPASMVEIAKPQLVKDFRTVQKAKETKRAGKSTAASNRPSKVKGARAQSPPPRVFLTQEEEESEEDTQKRGTAKTTAMKKKTVKAKTTATRAKSPPAAICIPDEEEESEEEIHRHTHVQVRRAKDRLAIKGKKADQAVAIPCKPKQVDDFFHVGKSIRQPKSVSTTSKVAALFDSSKDKHSTNSGHRSNDACEGEVSAGCRGSLLTQLDSAFKGTILSSGSSTSKGNSQFFVVHNETDPCARVPRPFPMLFEPGETINEDDDKKYTLPALLAPFPKQFRKKQNTAADTGDSASTMQKSPRISRKQTSPRSATRIASHDDNHRPRSPSPSPLRSQPTMLAKFASTVRASSNRDTSYIEISSDSDDATSLCLGAKLPLPPEKDARSSSSSRSSFMIGVKDKKLVDPVDIIDLT